MESLQEFALRQLDRLPYFRGLWAKFPIGSIQSKVDFGIFGYPHYAYGVYWSAMLASRLKIPAISVIEFGVAGGRGLLALEEASAEIAIALGVQIDVFGFDSGQGMPEASDYRDLPHIWSKGFYQMDVAKLEAMLKSAKLVLGDVGTTVPTWMAEDHAPIGFAAFDLDYYSSTVAAFKLFEGEARVHLPRVHCYFDDVACTDLGCMNPFVGELLAIQEFNDGHPSRKIARVEQLRLGRQRWEDWQERIFAFHDFAHPRYTELVIPRDAKSSQLPL